MGTPNRYAQRVPKPRFTPTDEQQRLLDELAAVAAEQAAVEARYRELLAACASADIPIATLAELLGYERKTVYRHLGRPMQ